MPYQEFQVIGRRVPTEKDPKPKIYRLKVFAKNHLLAKSKFWYFMNKTKKIKKTKGEVLSVNQIFEKNPNTVKNFGVFLRYDSKSGTHNIYKEYRDTSRVGAATQLYNDMAGRYRARENYLQIISLDSIPANKCKRPNTTQFHNNKIKFPLTHRIYRPAFKKDRRTFTKSRLRCKQPAADAFSSTRSPDWTGPLMLWGGCW